MNDTFSLRLRSRNIYLDLRIGTQLPTDTKLRLPLFDYNEDKITAKPNFNRRHQIIFYNRYLSGEDAVSKAHKSL